MAVYTPLTADTLVGWLASHDVGSLTGFEGIAAGIENSNFFVETDLHGQRRTFVLTIFERLSHDELAYCLSLMRHLAIRGVACPAPTTDRHGALWSPIAGKPAALVTRLAGRSVERPGVAHCRAMGTELATMHRASDDFTVAHPNPRGVAWWIAAAARVRDHLDSEQRQLLDDEIGLQAATWPALASSLPSGAIHADLFRDNALFVDAGTTLGGVIDFYFAGDDVRVLDLATCLNDWCVDPEDGSFVPELLDAFVTAYAAVRPLERAERDAMPQMLRAAALRFWLSRVDDLHRPRAAALLKPHDPRPFERILRRRRTEALATTGPLARWTA